MSTRAQIKANFQTGDIPTQANFEDLIDSLAHASEDGLATDAEVAAAVASHANSTSTPHSVTKAQVGLGNVNNTSDADKPISTATQSALDAKQPLDSDLTAIAALSTTTFGRALLTAASQTALVAFPVVTESTTSRTLGLTDAQKYIRCTNSSAVTVTVPPQADVAWVADTEIIIFQSGTGLVTIAAGAGVTINTPETLVSAKRYATLTLKRVAENVWDLSGNLEAA